MTRKTKCKAIAGAALVCTLCSCASIYERSGTVFTSPYHGARTALQNAAESGEAGSYAPAAAAVDIPLSFAVDTVLLPLDAVAWVTRRMSRGPAKPSETCTETPVEITALALVGDELYLQCGTEVFRPATAQKAEPACTGTWWVVANLAVRQGPASGDFQAVARVSNGSPAGVPVFPVSLVGREASAIPVSVDLPDGRRLVLSDCRTIDGTPASLSVVITIREYRARWTIKSRSRQMP